jgi:hypothetical protein
MVGFFNRLNARFPKRVFNPNSNEDLKMYKYFLDNHSWGNGGCPFELEWPWLSIPDMISHKIAENTVAKV